MCDPGKALHDAVALRLPHRNRPHLDDITPAESVIAGAATLEHPEAVTLCAVANSCLGVATSVRVLTGSLPAARYRHPGADRSGTGENR